MNNWLTFLQTQGATLNGAQVAAFTGTAEGDENALLIPLTHIGVIAIEGEAASQFLQGQVTCDVDQVTENNSLPGAQCNPKGRMLSSFQILKSSADTLLLVMSADLLESTLASLQKYAVFFKATLRDASNDYTALGLVGSNSATIIRNTFGTTPTALNDVTPANDTLILNCADSTYLLLTPANNTESTWLSLAEKAQPAGLPAWQLQMIRAGLGQVVNATHELFIPQMLNLQAIDGISFKKGCYTGQEVVARMKYLGKLKRRMYHLLLDTTIVPASGTVCKLTAEGQGVGNIVTAAANDNRVEVLAVLTTEAAQSKQLLFGNEESVSITLAELPYSLETS